MLADMARGNHETSGRQRPYVRSMVVSAPLRVGSGNYSRGGEDKCARAVSLKSSCGVSKEALPGSVMGVTTTNSKLTHDS